MTECCRRRHDCRARARRRAAMPARRSTISPTNILIESCRARGSRPVPATTAAPVTPLSPLVASRLRGRGIDDLWSHQAAAVDALRAGRNVVVATGTASGKSLSYQIPIVESVVEGAARHRAPRVPHQGIGPGPTAHPSRVVRPRSRRRHLRRRHRQRRTHVGASPRQRAADQPRNAAHGDPPVTRPLGDVPDAAPLRRRRRTAHVARRLRESRRARAAPPAHGSASTTAAIPSFCFTSATIGNPARARIATLWPARSRRSTTTVHPRPSEASWCGNDH